MPELEIQDPNIPVKIEFEMKGPAFATGIPIPLAIKSLEAVQGIVDRSYLVLANKRKLSAFERSQFYLSSKDIHHSSLKTDLELIFAAVQPVLPFISNLGPTGVWEFAKHTFEFLKLVYSSKQEGIQVNLTINGDNNTVSVNTGSQTSTFSQQVMPIAIGSLPHYEYLAKQLNDDRVQDIRLGSGSQRDIALTLADSNLFSLPSTIEEQILPVCCEVFEFDKYDGDGKLSVFPDQPIPRGEYKFQVIGRQDLNEYIEAMKHSQVVLTCLKEMVDHPLFGPKIVSLQVTNVRA